MTAHGDLDQARIGELHATEVARFREARPRSRAMIARAREHMPNGAPMVWMAFHDDQLVYIDHGEGPGFTDIDGFGYVDFNASDMAMFCGHANPAIVAAVQARAARSTQFLLPTEESVAVAEELARRYPVGQWQFTLSATQANTEAIRLARSVTGRVRIAQFNDPGTLRAALASGDVALVLPEPAMSNNIHLLLPEPGWHAALREMTRQHGTLLAL